MVQIRDVARIVPGRCAWERDTLFGPVPCGQTGAAYDEWRLRWLCVDHAWLIELSRAAASERRPRRRGVGRW